MTSIDADIDGDRKETVIAGWVHCDDEELTINTDISCEDSECNVVCHCFVVEPSIHRHQDQQQQQSHGHHHHHDENTSAVDMTMDQFMFTEGSNRLSMGNFDDNCCNQEKVNSLADTVVDSRRLNYYHHFCHCDDDFTETESETSFEGDNEVSDREPPLPMVCLLQP